MADAINVAAVDSVVRLVEEPEGGWRGERVVPAFDARCLGVDPLDRRRIYAGGETKGLFVSEDGGATWSPVPAQPPSTHVYSIAVSPLERRDGLGALYVGTEPSSIYKSEDGGRTWSDLESLRKIPSAPTWSFPPRPWTSHVRQIAPSPHDPNLLVVGIELGGVMRSDDGGKTWQDHPEGAYKDCHALAVHPERPGLFYEAGAGGFAASLDGGLTWKPMDQGIDRRYCYSMAVDFADPELVWVGASVDARHAHYTPNDAQAAVYRRQPDGTWQAVTGELSPPLPQFPYSIATHPDRPGTVYVGFGDGSLAISTDGGTTWTKPDITGDRPREFMAMVVV